MVDASGQHVVDRPSQVVVRLPRGAVDEVEVDMREAGCPGHPGSGHPRARRVRALEHPQDTGGRALHSQRDPREPGLPEVRQHPLIHAVRVGLRGHLGIRRQVEFAAHGVEQRGEAAGPEQGRRATSDEYRVDGPTRRTQPGRSERDLGRQHLVEGVSANALPELKGGIGVEVAVSAAARAERDVQVEPEAAAIPHRYFFGASDVDSAAMKAS